MTKTTTTTNRYPDSVLITYINQYIKQTGYIDTRAIASQTGEDVARIEGLCLTANFIRSNADPYIFFAPNQLQNPSWGQYTLPYTSPTMTVNWGGAAAPTLTTKLKPKRIKKIVTKPKISFDSVILAQEKKDQILAAISQTKHEKTIFEKWGFGSVFEKGTAISLLFWGIPGTGKTLMAQAIADHLDYELKLYGTAEIESMEPGGAERMIQQIFAEAKGKNRIICLDECDSLLTTRAEAGMVIGAQINTLLQEIEKFTGILILTTNRLGKLDPALERRITTKIEFPFPDKKARLAIWKRMIPKKAPLSTDIRLEKLAEYQLAGGNIKNAVLNAVRTAAYNKEKTLSMKYFNQSVEQEIASLKAFMEEYDANPHQQLMGYSRGQNGLTIDKKKDNFISSINLK